MPGAAGLAIGLLRLEEPPDLGEVSGRCGADGHDRPHPSGLEDQLWRASCACGAAARVADPVREEARCPADAAGRDRGDQPPSQTREAPAIADHIRAELVVDALDMARWRRKPEPGTVVHSDRGSQYTSWAFGHRLRQAGLLGSMGRVASSVDNGLMESFWSTMQRELLDQRVWQSRDELGQAIFEWIEAWYNPRRRHSGIGDVSPLEFEDTHHAALAA